MSLKAQFPSAETQVVRSIVLLNKCLCACVHANCSDQSFDSSSESDCCAGAADAVWAGETCSVSVSDLFPCVRPGLLGLTCWFF